MPTKLTDKAQFEILKEFEVVARSFDAWRHTMQVDEVCVCVTKLFVALASKWHDLQRMGRFHAITVPDRYKDAAFFTYWIVKIQPVQHTCDVAIDGNCVKKIASNTAFAIHFALNRMGVGMSAVPFVFLRNLFYTLVYRYVSPEHLALTYQALFEQPPQ